MRILILAPRYPFPVHGGDVLRIYNICQVLKNQGHQLDLISFYEPNDIIDKSLNNIFTKIYLIKRNKYLSIFNSLLYILSPFPSQIGYYYQKNFLKKFTEISDNYDMTICHLIRMARYIDKGKCHKKSILEMTDAISLNYKRSLKYLNFIQKAFFFIEMNKLKKYEKKCLDRFKKTIVVSDTDKDFLEEKIKYKSLKTLTNGYKSLSMNLFSKSNKSVIFIGNMRTNANHLMVTFFIKEVLPELRRVYPALKFKVIGAEPRKELIQLQSKIDFEITGKVESIHDEMRDAALSVCPMFFGAGVQNKILESMAFGIPVVATDIGIEGLLKNARDSIVIGNNKKEIVDGIIGLMEDSDKREMLSKKSYKFILENYSWNKILSSYLD